MRSKFSTVMAVGMLVAMSAAAQNANAVTIDFDSQGLSGPSMPPVAQTVSVGTSIGTVTFSGGALATQLTGLSADTTTVYFDGAASLPFAFNPITITSPTAITNLSLDIFNLELTSETFKLTDNLGNTVTDTLAPNASGGPSLVTFAGGGTMVTIDDGNATGFDFAIDNISFGQQSSNVPEPATLVLLAAGLAGLGLARRRRA